MTGFVSRLWTNPHLNVDHATEALSLTSSIGCPPRHSHEATGGMGIPLKTFLWQRNSARLGLQCPQYNSKPYSITRLRRPRKSIFSLVEHILNAERPKTVLVVQINECYEHLLKGAYNWPPFERCRRKRGPVLIFIPGRPHTMLKGYRRLRQDHRQRHKAQAFLYTQDVHVSRAATTRFRRPSPNVSIFPPPRGPLPMSTAAHSVIMTSPIRVYFVPPPERHDRKLHHPPLPLAFFIELQ
ncbi:hypothetical protein HGRIS_014791 [Hohenbuehelia grisea]|uniref:Uncharacterized protein n=1 Tax=Hohenbuehelia grisea TaxID=104357 RepID=A0ABR3IQS0_9AGAR